ncbi:hypothetical protein niasHT_032174 [Heterodera trifolii]|uniref:Uncharacterized protein n=1 Tax=Heterodera trifolii TaxID=157864 RepID=A0ABD2HQW3_9BILA
MSDNRKEAEKKMAKSIFISADCWLSVFDFLEPFQLGLGISMTSHRFAFYVDEHFKTRKWALKSIRIRSKIGENGTKEMKIANCYWEPLPLLKIHANFIDRNAIAFLHRFRQFFAAGPINLDILTTTDRILEFILRNIWPLIAKKICGFEMWTLSFHRLRQFAPSIQRFSISSLCLFHSWQFRWIYEDDGNLTSKIEAFKAAFTSASSPVNCIVSIWFRLSSLADSVVPFNRTNELTQSGTIGMAKN